MTIRWYILHGGKETGPYTADELRLGIRRGDVDPFDVAYQEGSQVRRVLLDIDEVFDTSGAVYQIAVAEPLAFPSRTNPEPTRISRPVSDASRLRADRGDSDKVVQDFREAAKDDRKYSIYLGDKKLFGPLKPKGVAAAFRSGQVGKRAKVIKEGSDSKIAIEKFLDRYEGSRGGGQGKRDEAQLTNDAQSRVVGTFKRKSFADFPKGRRQLVAQAIPLLSLLAVLAGLVIGYLVLKSLGVDRVIGSLVRQGEARVASQLREAELRDLASIAPDVSKNIESIEVLRPKPPVAFEPTAPPKTDRPVAISAADMVIRPEATPEKPSRRPPEKSRLREPRPNRIPPRPQTSEPFRPLYQSPPRPIDQGIRSPPLTVGRPSSFVSTPRPASPRGGALRAQVGKMVTLPRMTYSIAALESCPLKCRLTFTGPSGIVVGVFFKGAFEGRLQSARGMTKIRGMLKEEGGGFVVYLQP